MNYDEGSENFYRIQWPQEDAPLKVKDVETAHTYSDEFLRVHCPLLPYKELDRKESSDLTELSKQWGEQLGGLEFSRELNVRVFPQFDQPLKRVHTVRGNEINRGIKLYFGILELRRQNLFPTPGDHVIYGNLDYEIVDTYCEPQNLWQQTNTPLWITVDAVIYRFGDVRHLAP